MKAETLREMATQLTNNISSETHKFQINDDNDQHSIFTVGYKAMGLENISYVLF